MDTLYELGVINFAKNLLVAIILLFAGLYFIRFITRIMKRQLERKRVDPSLKSFLLPVVENSLKIVLFIMVIRQIGIEASSLIALITSAGLAVGLALQGSLSNFAGGVLLLLLRPFRVGDYIEVEGFSGTVQNISIFYTELKSDNGQQVFIPNGDLSNASVVNYSVYPERRIDVTVSVSYKDDPKKVKNVLLDLVHTLPLIEQEPAPTVNLKAYTLQSIDFSIRLWVKREHYGKTLNELLPAIKDVFAKTGITMSQPQIEVHVIDKNRQ